MSNENEDGKDLSLMKEMYRLRIKTTLAFVKKISFEEFLKKHFEINSKISVCDLFQNAIWDSMLSVEYAIKKKDDELLECINAMIATLENEEGDGENIPLGKIFAKLLIKAKNICEAELPVPSIAITFEFNYFLETFKERIIKKMLTADKRDVEKFYGLMNYSNN